MPGKLYFNLQARWLKWVGAGLPAETGYRQAWAWAGPVTDRGLGAKRLLSLSFAFLGIDFILESMGRPATNL